MRLAIILALLASTPVMAKDRIKEGMGYMDGKPVKELFAMIGPPDRQEDFLGTKVFFWEPKTIADAIPCRLKVEVSDQNTISAWGYSGSEMGCQDLTFRFKRGLKKLTAPPAYPDKPR